MKLLLTAFIASLFLISCSGSESKDGEGGEIAQLAAGTYTGTGAVSGLGFSENCDTVRLIVAATSTQISIEERIIRCPSIQNTLERPVKLDIQGTNLFYNGTQVGTISREKIQLAYSQDGYRINVLFKANGTNYSYAEAWTSVDPAQNIQFNSTLRKN